MNERDEDDIYDDMLTNVMWWLQALAIGCMIVFMLYMVGAL